MSDQTDINQPEDDIIMSARNNELSEAQTNDLGANNEACQVDAPQVDEGGPSTRQVDGLNAKVNKEEYTTLAQPDASDNLIPCMHLTPEEIVKFMAASKNNLKHVHNPHSRGFGTDEKVISEKFKNYIRAMIDVYYLHLKNSSEAEVDAFVKRMANQNDEDFLKDATNRTLQELPDLDDVYVAGLRRGLSTRVVAVLNFLTAHLAQYEDLPVAIVDEWLCWLSVLEVILPRLRDRLPGFPEVPILLLNGRMSAEEREAVLEEFKKAVRPKIILMTREVSYQGMNVQCVDLVVETQI